MYTPFEDGNAQDHKNDSFLDETTVEAMQEYFHVLDRDILLKYVRDTLLSASGRNNQIPHNNM
jgi:hypothetical protein